MTATSPTTRFVELAGRKVQWTQGGSGPDLIYLHSAGGETEWTSFHDRLARHFTVHVPAHPGFALSTGLESIRDIQDMAWHYVDLFEAMGWQQVPVVGFSLGGWLTLEIAILRPQLIRKALLVAPAGVRVPQWPYAELFIDDLNALRRLVFHDPDHPSVPHALPTSLDDPRMLNWLRAREATARVGWNPYLHNPKLPDHLHRIPFPVQIVWGDDDRLIPPRYAQWLAERIPQAETTILPQCGHMVPYEREDDFCRLVTSFCQ